MTNTIRPVRAGELIKKIDDELDRLQGAICALDRLREKFNPDPAYLAGTIELLIIEAEDAAGAVDVHYRTELKPLLLGIVNGRDQVDPVSEPTVHMPAR